MHDSDDHLGQGVMAGVERRLVFLKVENMSGRRPIGIFSINAVRTPEFMVDMDIHNLTIHDIRALPGDTGWGSVPTPIF